jgi:hypothetical protein
MFASGAPETCSITSDNPFWSQIHVRFRLSKTRERLRQAGSALWGSQKTMQGRHITMELVLGGT